MRNQQIQNQKGRKRGQHSEAKKTMLHGATLRNIFIDRTNVFLGLTKFETISEYYNKKLSTVLNYDEKEIKKLWDEIQYIKKYLRKKRIMAIVSRPMQRGFQLTDNKFGTRQLENNQSVYYNCSTKDDALSYRGRLNKVATGIFQAGKDVEEMTEELNKQKEILKVVN